MFAENIIYDDFIRLSFESVKEIEQTLNRDPEDEWEQDKDAA